MSASATRHNEMILMAFAVGANLKWGEKSQLYKNYEGFDGWLLLRKTRL